jgi:hypothetical protein
VRATSLLPQRMLPAKEMVMIKGLLVGIVVFLVATFPATWLLMLFLGNVGLAVGYWGTLPIGILVSALLGGVSSPAISHY